MAALEYGAESRHGAAFRTQAYARMTPTTQAEPDSRPTPYPHLLQPLEPTHVYRLRRTVPPG